MKGFIWPQYMVVPQYMEGYVKYSGARIQNIFYSDY